MIWFKSFGAGLLAVLISIPVGVVLLQLILKARTGLPIGVDVVSLSRQLTVRLTFLLIFALGCAWEYRRLAPR